MNYLLDTTSFLWFVYDDRRLSSYAVDTIESSDNEIHLSLASIWEIAIKVNLRRGLELRRPFPEFIDEHLSSNRFELLEINVAHLKRVHDLPYHHRDPFDRLLIAQAQVENIPVITSDAAFDQYPIQRV
ncbi:MAG: type II toxin-antitoxin system VapC family toxin [Chloroflexota bacterium]|nr:type II toxin-antitoxin system VapC family toxin [Chloroflexota bacterium]MDE2907988.1 type II toxin-antitoxin system VapC family toxin [Chloroflexota bacterium]